MEIKKGMQFRCIKDCSCGIGSIVYRKGNVYESYIDGCITDIRGNDEHIWGELARVYFEKIEGDGKELLVEQPKQSVKNDFKDGKLRWDLLPLELIEEIVKVYDAGAKKYGANNWKNLEENTEKYKSALLRHLAASEKEDIDEDGCYHIAKICWNALSMLHFKLTKK